MIAVTGVNGTLAVSCSVARDSPDQVRDRFFSGGLTGMDTLLDNGAPYKKTLGPLLKWFNEFGKKNKLKESKLHSDWNALTAILDAKQFRELQAPRSAPALVVRNSHPYTISVARQSGFQNMEFLTKESLKPYESELKPLLRWWKSSRNLRRLESNVPVDSRCSLRDVDAIFSY